MAVPSSSPSRDGVWATLPEQTVRCVTSGIPNPTATTSTLVPERLSLDAGRAGSEGSNEPQVRLTSSSASLSRSGLVSVASSKQNCPTAKVAPIVESQSRRTRAGDDTVLRTLSPKLTRHTGFTGTESGVDKASWDSEEEKRKMKQLAAGRLLRETHSPGRKGDLSSEKLRSLMTILEEKNQIIERLNIAHFIILPLLLVLLLLPLLLLLLLLPPLLSSPHLFTPSLSFSSSPHRQKLTISRLQQECREKDIQMSTVNRERNVADVRHEYLQCHS